MLFANLWRLVCFVREQSHNSCSLNSNSKRSLMFCANTAHTTGKDFALLGDEATELCNVLVVYVVNVIYAERAHFLFGHSLGSAGCFNFFCHFQILLKLEWKILVDGLEIVEIDVIGTVFIASGGEELHLVRSDFGDVATRTVLRVIASCLNAAADSRFAAFFEVACAVVRLSSPNYDREKICFSLAVFRVGTGHSKCKSAKFDTAVCGCEFWILCQIADQKHFVHSFSPYRLLLDDHLSDDVFVVAHVSVKF